MTTVPAELLQAFGARDPVQVAESGIATIWRVKVADGDAALKLYKNGDPQDEIPGTQFLQSRAGKGAVRILAYDREAVLMEYLDGPSLGDLSHAGQDTVSHDTLAEVAQALHHDPRPIPLPHLQQRFAALVDDPLSAGWMAPARDGLRNCQALARRLLDSQTDIRPLHGDLHHDNIRRGARGFLAFAAKGIFGERGYEYANAFMNPIDTPQITHNPRRIRQMAAQFAARSGIAPARLLDWAAAHCALSILWSGETVPDAQFSVLDLLITECAQASATSLG